VNGSCLPDVGGFSDVVEVVVGPVSFGLDYCALEVEGRCLVHSPPDGSSCQRVCHATGIVPPPSPVRSGIHLGGSVQRLASAMALSKGLRCHRC
jgi:hypothetical protein